jgi:4-hydroxy-tetrahydrodipicolinate reductase
VKRSRISTVVFGGLGRSGAAVVDLLRHDNRFSLAGIVDPSVREGDDGRRNQTSRDCAEVTGAVDMVIDFSLPAGTVTACGFSVSRSCPLITGTTGLTARQESVLRKASQRIAVVKASNMSRGAHTLFALCEQLKSILPPETDIEILEKHHRWKKDTPSGTALEIARILSHSPGTTRKRPVVVGRRKGKTMRHGREICIHSVRAGDAIGEHTIDVSWNDESIELTHRVRSRFAFARGALEAAVLVRDKPPGYYTIAQLIADAHA